MKLKIKQSPPTEPHWYGRHIYACVLTCTMKGFIFDTVITSSLPCRFQHDASHLGEPGSSVSTVSGYGLENQAIEAQSPPEAKGFL
jgi:hypothetical protein